MHPLPHDALTCLRQYLTATAAPFDFDALYDLTATEGMLAVGAHPVRRSEMARREYGGRWRALAASRPEAMVGPVFLPLKLLDWQPDKAGGNLLYSLKEQESGRVFSAAFRLHGPPWHVFGACVHGEALPSPALLEARTLAEFAPWSAYDAQGRWPVSGLAASFLRTGTGDPAPLQALPEARFTCQDRGDCCSLVDVLALPVDGQAHQALAGIRWEAVGLPGPAFARMPAEEETDESLSYRLGPAVAGGCHARVGGRCSVHRAVGWQPLEPCQTHPYQFIATPDGICVTTSFLCQTVGENQGQPITANETAVRRRLQRVRHQVQTIPETVPLGPETGVLTWAAYRLLEDHLLATLADRRLGDVHARLQRGHQVLAALVAICSERPQTDEQVVADVLRVDLPPLRPFPSHRADDLMRLLFRRSRLEPPAYSPFAGGRYDAWQFGRGATIGDRLDDELVTRYLRTVLFRKLGLSLGGAVFAWGTVAWAARAWERQTLWLANERQAPIDRRLQLDTARMLDFGLLHEGYLQAFLFDPRLRVTFTDPRTWISLGAR